MLFSASVQTYKSCFLNIIGLISPFIYIYYVSYETNLISTESLLYIISVLITKIVDINYLSSTLYGHIEGVRDICKL